MKLREILVVDDSDADQLLAKLAIEAFDADITVHKAFDGEEALKILSAATTQPDLIFLDVNMPVMDGHEFLAAYSQFDQATSTVVMLSSSQQQRDIDAATRYAFVIDYLVKPLTKIELAQLVEAQAANL